VTGTVTGDVRVAGAVPAMTQVRFSGFPECGAQHREPVPAGDLRVQDGKLAGAFVWLKDGLGDRVFAIPTEPVEIDQSGCLYQPRVAGARVGQTIRFVNGDPLLHNVHGTPKASPPWNVSLSRRGAMREIRLDRPEIMVAVRCDLHPWMQAWLGIVDHPYFAVTGPDGAFTLPDVPPGDYTLAVWHERLGTRETRITLPPKGTATATFTYPGVP
jgi:plastocyanin